MDLSLDQIIESNNNNNQKKSQNKNHNRVKSVVVNKQKNQQKFSVKKQHLRAQEFLQNHQRPQSTKLIISNLDPRVTEAEIRDLFFEFGPLHSATLYYNKMGGSQGTADVIFERRSDAMKAMRQYNGVPLDGKLMVIEVACSEINQPQNRHGYRQYGPRQYVKQNNNNRGSNKFGRHDKKRNDKKKPPTKEELDEEMDKYIEERKKQSCNENVKVKIEQE